MSAVPVRNDQSRFETKNVTRPSLSVCWPLPITLSGKAFTTSTVAPWSGANAAFAVHVGELSTLKYRNSRKIWTSMSTVSTAAISGWPASAGFASSKSGRTIAGCTRPFWPS
jgi:hypothetical protein